MHSHTVTSVVLTVVFLSSVVQAQNITNGKGCYYKGSYHHGNWTDGCDFNCTCLDVNTGHYKCKTRCPVYPQLPQGCVLKLPLGEECCRQPDCSAVTVPYTIITSNNGGNKSNSKNGDNGINNKNDTRYDKGNTKTSRDKGNNNIDSVKSDNNEHNNNTNTERNNSNKTSIEVKGNNKNDNGFHDKNDNNNQSYINNQHNNESNNTFSKSDVRSSYVSDNGDFNTTLNNNDFNNITGSQNSTKEYYFESTNTTEIYNLNKTVEGIENGCLYKGVYYHSNWTDGCDLKCTCEDPLLGTYRCRKRCREYIDIGPGCTLILSPEDDCCWVPECNSTESAMLFENFNSSDHINYTESYTKVVNTKHLDHYTDSELSFNTTFVDNMRNIPNDINKNNTVTDDSMTSVTPTTLPPIIIASPKTTTSLPEIFPFNPKLTEHTNQIDKEHNGYNVISDGNKVQNGNTDISNAKETEKLAIIFSRFGPVRLFTVKKDVYIESTNKDKQNYEIHNTTEVFKQRGQGVRQNIVQTKGFAKDIGYFVKGEVCQYKGKTYQQDERWNDGCNKTCVCDDATRGIYKCRSRCTEYKALPIGCIMRQSQVDSCCLVPDCRQATVANGDQMLTTSRLLSEIQQAGKTEKSLLKELFNQRNEMRNKISQHKDLTTNVEITNHFQNVPIVIKTGDFDRRILQHLVDKTNNSSINLQNYNQLPNSNLQNKDSDMNTSHRNRRISKQQIVTPYNLIYSNLKNNRGTNAHRRFNDSTKQKQEHENRPFRTIATQTGLYKVRKKDGVITSSSRSQGISNALNKMVDESSSRNRDQSNNNPGYCMYRGRRYNESDKLFDGCERMCVCQSNGQFICKPRCPVYRRVPSGCALVSPRAGQCCSTLVCRRIPTRNNPPSSYLSN